MEFILKVLKHFACLKKGSQNILIFLLKFSFSRKITNSFYNSLNYKEKKQFHALFADMFRNRNYGINGQWVVRFLNTKITIPFSKAECWLEWETALSILGHDIEVKETYEYLLNKGLVQSFFDIGANYGTHSLLFLSQNIQTTTFEPNPACHKYFHELLKANNLSNQVESFAIGENDSITKLVFPEKETWLGKINNNEKPLINMSLDQNVIDVKIITLDGYIEKSNLRPDLIKIDTEGFEEFVIKGAIKTLLKYKPLVIFECDPDKRDTIFDLLVDIEYDIYSLPIINSKNNKITKETFLTSKLNNFITIHRDCFF